MPTRPKVLVIGGGPGGSTAATLLAREGIAVTLAEREAFPRYHIGESLLPSTMHVLDVMGAREKVDRHGFQRKEGAYISWGPEEWDFSFGELSGNRGYSYQVIRSEFDQLLLEHARSQGVEVLDRTDVTGLTFDGSRPCAASTTSLASSNGDPREHGFHMLVDASGRASVMSTRYLKNRRYHQAFQNVGIWGYWRGAERLPRGPFGAIAVCSVPSGWFWAIPLHDGTLSVGLVAGRERVRQLRQEGVSLEEIYTDALAQCPTVQAMVAPARRTSELKVEQDYSYSADQFAGPGFFLVGDAACFLDPLLSTGVHLAMFSGLLAAACIASIARGDIDEDEAIPFYEDVYRQAYLRLLVLVSTFYEHYQGKDGYFWEAQKLTRNDYSERKMNAAFIHIVSGIEDLRDAGEHAGALIHARVSEAHAEGTRLLQNKALLGTLAPADRARALEKAGLAGALLARFSLTPETAVRGLYVVTSPRLGVARVGR